jgi:hypothetical protein
MFRDEFLLHVKDGACPFNPHPIAVGSGRGQKGSSDG